MTSSRSYGRGGGVMFRPALRCGLKALRLALGSLLTPRSPEKSGGLPFWQGAIMNTNYILITAALFIPALAIILHTWQHTIRPMQIPKAETQTLAAKLIKTHGNNAYDFAHTQEDKAWRNSETYEQAKWRKVGKRHPQTSTTPLRLTTFSSSF